MSKKLSEAPLVHETAEVGELDARPLDRDRRTQPCFGKRPRRLFLHDAGLRRLVRDNWQIRQHRRLRAYQRHQSPDLGGRHCTISPIALRTIGDDAQHDSDFFAQRRAKRVTIGHDTWLGHGSTLPASPSAMALRSAPARLCRRMSRPTPSSAACRQSRSASASTAARRERYQALAWWDWDHARLRAALDDFRELPAEAFLEKYGG